MSPMSPGCKGGPGYGIPIQILTFCGKRCTFSTWRQYRWLAACHRHFFWRFIRITVSTSYPIQFVFFATKLLFLYVPFFAILLILTHLFSHRIPCLRPQSWYIEILFLLFEFFFTKYFLVYTSSWGVILNFIYSLICHHPYHVSQLFITMGSMS